MLLSLSHIRFKSFISMILKAIWLLTPFLIIRWTISTAIQSFLTFLLYSPGFLRIGQDSTDTKSHTSFLISMDSVIPDYTGQFKKPMSFLHLAYLLLMALNSFAMGRGCVFLRFLVYGKLWNIVTLQRVFFSSWGARFFEGFYLLGERTRKLWEWLYCFWYY